ncbi:MAG: hypothetical protein E5W27_03265 [Mesorhizobium sp.]|nr:MAG: hypothetical protein E5W27_03265 [Mesorhizobium sp.]
MSRNGATKPVGASARFVQPRSVLRRNRVAGGVFCFWNFMKSLSAYRAQWFGNVRRDLLAGLVPAQS